MIAIAEALANLGALDAQAASSPGAERLLAPRG